MNTDADWIIKDIVLATVIISSSAGEQSIQTVCRGITVTLCHPGPVATGVGGQVRSLYGPQGQITVHEPEGYQKGRLGVKRVAQLILKAAYHNVESCWISTHPILLTGECSSTSVIHSCVYWAAGKFVKSNLNEVHVYTEDGMYWEAFLWFKSQHCPYVDLAKRGFLKPNYLTYWATLPWGILTSSLSCTYTCTQPRRPGSFPCLNVKLESLLQKLSLYGILSVRDFGLYRS